MSSLFLSDIEVDRLLMLPKRVTNPGARMKMQRGSELTNYEVTGEGHEFRLYVRQNTRISNGFSCGLLVVAPSGDLLTLVRYNGSDHQHTNPLESSAPMEMSCHIHRATERYMAAGKKAEHYAVATDGYSDLAGALQMLLRDCKIEGLKGPEISPQRDLL